MPIRNELDMRHFYIIRSYGGASKWTRSTSAIICLIEFRCLCRDSCMRHRRPHRSRGPDWHYICCRHTISRITGVSRHSHSLHLCKLASAAASPRCSEFYPSENRLLRRDMGGQRCDRLPLPFSSARPFLHADAAGNPQHSAATAGPDGATGSVPARHAVVNAVWRWRQTFGLCIYKGANGSALHGVGRVRGEGRGPCTVL